MYTRCPHCQAVFQVTTAELTASDGNVRCGECSRVFNGLDSLSVMPPEGEVTDHGEGPVQGPHGPHGPPATPAPGESGIPVLPVEHVATASGTARPPRSPPETDPPEAVGTGTGGQAIPLVIRDDIRRHAAADRQHILSSASLGVLCTLLIVLLAGQVVYHERERLLVYPEFAPALRWMCERMDCTLSPTREPDAFQVSSRNIYTHPNAPDALMVQAQFTNRAAFAQPPPLVELSFRDLQGRVLAVRRFTPAEYLQRAPANATLASGDSIQLHLEIEDPGPQAVSYEFRFF